MARNFVIALSIVTVVGVGAAVATPASALTVDEIQVQIRELLAKVGELTKQLNILQDQNTSTTVADTGLVGSQHRICGILNRNLSRGTLGDDVMSLQEFLQSEGYFSANATGYFGPMTQQAVARWQASQGVSAVGSIGPVSRERIKNWCGGNTERFSAEPRRGAVPLTVWFTFIPSVDDGGRYYVEFGDGQGQLMDIQQIYCIKAPCISPSVASHTYASAGTYTATVSRYIACLYTDPRCMIAQPPPLARVQILVTGGSSGNNPPVVSGFAGPTSLTLNETGTWKVQASDPENGPLSYSITWGDEWYAGNAALQTSAKFSVVQTTTFTHSYSTAGTYTVAVIVRDSAGNEARTTATVVVSDNLVACTMEYAPVCGQPPEPACRHSIPACMIATPGPQTYGNRCMMNAAGATFIREGACNTY